MLESVFRAASNLQIITAPAATSSAFGTTDTVRFELAEFRAELSVPAWLWLFSLFILCRLRRRQTRHKRRRGLHLWSHSSALAHSRCAALRLSRLQASSVVSTGTRAPALARNSSSTCGPRFDCCAELLRLFRVERERLASPAAGSLWLQFAAPVCLQH